MGELIHSAWMISGDTLEQFQELQDIHSFDVIRALASNV